MTLLEFCRLLKQYLAWVIVVPVVCCIIAAGVSAFVLPAQYSAEATIRSSTAVDIASLGGIVQSAAQNVSADEGIEITSQTNTSTRSVSVTAEGSSADGILAALNEVSLQAQTETQSLFGEEVSVSASIPQSAEDISPSPLKCAGAALLAGLFVVICVVVIVDRVKDPIHSAEEVEEAYDLPFLGTCAYGVRAAGAAGAAGASYRSARRESASHASAHHESASHASGHYESASHVSGHYESASHASGSHSKGSVAPAKQADSASGDTLSGVNDTVSRRNVSGGIAKSQAVVRETLLANIIFAGNEAQ